MIMAANMNLAIELIQNIADISCFGHTLQLAVTSGLGILLIIIYACIQY